MIQSRRRRRRYAYPVPSGPRTPRWGRAVVVLLVVTVLLFLTWTVLRLFSSGGEQHRVATTLQTSERGRVEVTINKGEPQRAESGLRLYAGDAVRTDGSAYATLQFFDGTVVVLDHGSTVEVEDALEGEEQSSLSFTLLRGRIYVRTGDDTVTERTMTSSFATYHVPSRTTVVLGGDGDAMESNELLAVPEATGPGVTVQFLLGGLARDEILTGEGQELHLSTSSLSELKERGGDPYDLRTALDHRLYSDVLYLFSSARSERTEDDPIPFAEEDVPEEEGEPLVITAPEDDALLTEGAVIVEGAVQTRVTSVRVNGYVAELSDGTFRKEIALSEEEEITIEVQAEDRDGLVIATQTLTVRRDIQPPDAPHIVMPVEVTLETMGEAEPFPVQEESFEITGEASDDAIGIIVNGYRLQKYQQGKPWSYLVDPAIGNVTIGENTYEVTAVDRSGNTSESVRIVILWKAEPLPVITEERISRDESTYLYPGSLRVIVPTSDDVTYTTSDAEVLIEGETHPETYSVSVNGYSLSLYEPGKVTWNYIAKEEFRNYKQGVNRYVIAARNAEGKILDVVRYTVERR
jgi:archaellum component FlaG (FlaF/FlaG flagellin family)